MNTPEDNPYTPPQTPLSPTQPVSDKLAPYLDGIQFPLTLTFRVFTLSPRIDVVDASGRPVLHAKQKIFKLKEHIEIFNNAEQSQKLADIRADRVIDWSARYGFTDNEGALIGAVGRKGWRSLWKAHYEVFNPGDLRTDFNIQEENPFAKFVDGLIGEIPLIGLITLYFFHPRYGATRGDGSCVLRLHKRPAFLQRKFTIEKVGDATPRELMNLLLSFIMVTMLERQRG